MYIHNYIYVYLFIYIYTYTYTVGGVKALLLFQCVAYTTDAARSMRCTERQCAAYPMDATFSNNQHRTKQRMIKKTQGLLETLCKKRVPFCRM